MAYNETESYLEKYTWENIVEYYPDSFIDCNDSGIDLSNSLGNEANHRQYVIDNNLIRKYKVFGAISYSSGLGFVYNSPTRPIPGAYMAGISLSIPGSNYYNPGFTIENWRKTEISSIRLTKDTDCFERLCISSQHDSTTWYAPVDVAGDVTIWETKPEGWSCPVGSHLDYGECVADDGWEWDEGCGCFALITPGIPQGPNIPPPELIPPIAPDDPDNPCPDCYTYDDASGMCIYTGGEGCDPVEPPCVKTAGCDTADMITGRCDPFLDDC